MELLLWDHKNMEMKRISLPWVTCNLLMDCFDSVLQTHMQLGFHISAASAEKMF